MRKNCAVQNRKHCSVPMGLCCCAVLECSAHVLTQCMTKPWLSSRYIQTSQLCLSVQAGVSIKTFMSVANSAFKPFAIFSVL